MASCAATADYNPQFIIHCSEILFLCYFIRSRYAICIYNSSKTFTVATYIRENFDWGEAVLENGDTLRLTLTKSDIPVPGYARICVKGSGASLYMTYDEEMPTT